MSDLPLVSIIVVSYNQGKYLRENLDSIKAQTYPNIELIVADDASPDNSVEIFNEWLTENNYPSQKNYHTKNTGLATTLNECVEMVSGKYIKFIAADDFLHPESIEKCVKKLEELGEEYGMVHTNFHYIDDDSKITDESVDLTEFNDVDKDEFRKNLIKRNTVAALSVVVRKSVLLETGLYDNSFLVEDYYRWLKISRQFDIGYIPEKLAYYRFHEHNISLVKKDQMIDEDIRLKLMYDDTGVAQNVIKDYFISSFHQKKQISAEAWKLYQKYKWRDKALVFMINNKIPFLFYKIKAKLIHG